LPACTDPIPIGGRFDRHAPEFWATSSDRGLAAAVASEYGLKLAFEGSTILTFPVTIDRALLAKMRCDRRIQVIGYSERLKNVLASERASDKSLERTRGG